MGVDALNLHLTSILPSESSTRDTLPEKELGFGFDFLPNFIL